MALENRKILGTFVAVLVGIVLLPIVDGFANDANITGTTRTIILLVPVFFALAVLFVALKGVA